MPPDSAKIIISLRNPIKRALSAYQYFKKLGKETRNPKLALLYEPKNDLQFSRYNNDFTYIEHGLYYRQLKQCLEYFPMEQILIFDFEDIHKNPEQLLLKS